MCWKNSYFRFSFSGGQQKESGVQSEAAGEGESSAATQEPGEPPQGREWSRQEALPGERGWEEEHALINAQAVDSSNIWPPGYSV